MATLTASQIASILRQQGFPSEKIPTMTAISLAESSGNPKAFNPNASTGDKSYGLFQVNMLGGLGPERMRQFGLKKEEELFDPNVNARAAKQILESQGLGAWSVYKGGQYKQFLPEAQKAFSSLGAQQPAQTQQTQPSQQAARNVTYNIYYPQDADRRGLLDPASLLSTSGANPGLDFLRMFTSRKNPTDAITEALNAQPDYSAAEPQFLNPYRSLS